MKHIIEILIAGGTTTDFATGATETVKRWARDLWVDMPREIYFGKFIKSDMNALIQEKRDLEGQPGDTVTFTLLNKLTGAGVTGDATLEGSEEAMVFYSDSVSLDQKRHAVRLLGKLSERRTAFSQRESAKTVLKTWLAETIDNDIFTAFDVSPSTVIFGGTATSTATITAADKFTPSLIDKAVAKAKKASPKIWPVRLANRDYFVAVIHTDVSYDLRQDATWNQAQRDAQERGDDNPIFTGMLGCWNGTVVHEHEKIPISTTYGAGGNLPGASNFFLGRQAGVIAWGSRPEWWEKEFNYGNSVGFAIGAIWKMKKAVFNTVDHAFIAIRTYRTNN